jgi:hypothetical protein
MTVSLSCRYRCTKDVSSAYFHSGILNEAEWPLSSNTFYTGPATKSVLTL